MNTEQAQNTEQRAGGEQVGREYTTRTSVRAARMAFAAQVEEHSRKRIERISDIGRAENQSVSPEVLEVANEELARLKRQVENQAQTIRVLTETIARLENTDINRLLSPKEPPPTPETTNVPGEPVAVHESAFDEGWQDGVSGKPQNLSRVCLGERELSAYLEGWEAGRKRIPVPVHTPPNVRRAGGE